MAIVYPPLSDEAWPEEIADMRDDFVGRLNVYRVMAHHPALVRAWADFRNHVVVNNALGQQRSEVVILRTGYRVNAPYEWNHHVSRARACGIQDDRIETIRGATETMNAEDAVLARAVDALIDDKRLPEETHVELSTLVL